MMNTQLTDQQIFDIAENTLLYANITTQSKDLSVDGDEVLCFARALLAAATPKRIITQLIIYSTTTNDCRELPTF